MSNKRTDFSQASSGLIKNLAFEETRKHCLDSINGVTLSCIMYIMDNCKKVVMSRHKKTIVASLKEAVEDGRLLFANGFYKVRLIYLCYCIYVITQKNLWYY